MKHKESDMVRVKLIFINLLVMVCFNDILSQANTDNQTSDFRNNPAFNKEIDFKNVDYKAIAEAIFFLTNEIRLNNRLKPLEYSKELGKAASMHARDMVEKDFFDHLNPYDPSRRTPNDRAKLCNIANPYLSENLIEGYGIRYFANDTVYFGRPGQFTSTPLGKLIKPHTYLSFAEAQLKGWMNSPGHRMNILAPDAFQMGCGAAGFTDHKFNDMPSFFVVQTFQRFEPIKQVKR